jgi:hypothetical protein
MRRWAKIGVLVLLGAWAPFLYRELTSEEVEKKGAAAFADDVADEPLEVEEGAGGTRAAAPGGEGAEEPAEAPAALKPGEEPAEPAAEEPAEIAEPSQPAPSAPGEADPIVPPAPVAAPSTEGAPFPAPAAPAAPALPMGGATAVFQRAFENEPRDALWAREAEARLVQILTGSQVPIETIKTARCQKTVCKLELSWKAADAAAYTSAYQAVRKEFGDELGVAPMGPGENEGEQRIDMYVPRQGYTIADLSR